MSDDTAELAKTKGGIAWQAGDFDGAVHWFGRAIELDPSDSQGQLAACYSNRSAAHLRLGDARAALKDAEECVRIKPSWAKGQSRHGNALFRLGKVDEAVAAYKKGLELDPSNEDLRKALLEVQRAAGGAGGAAGRRNTASFSGFVRQYPDLSAQAVIRLAAVCFAVLSLLPFAISAKAYRAMFICYAFSNLASILRVHGRPRMTKDYGAAVLQTWEVQGVMMAMLMVLQRPYVIAALPVLLTELTHLMYYASCMLQAVNPTKLKSFDARLEKLAPSVTGSLGWSTKPLNQRYTELGGSVAQICAQLEVMFGILLLVELMLPRRNLMLAILYWQFMRMRYMVDKSGNLKLAFGMVDEKISSVVASPRCPAIIGTLYGKMKDFMAGMVKLPEPGAAAPRPKCTIM